ncbi:serine/threonine-protein phosphatase 7 long form homolog isoform X2 [Castanea sativa]|uniref:serine/threonine-protein phosphatase 7 long form homolog isoform X2 n=1 Tax=Castanea sativa TaxID=21020 RepID=UPI003F654303
MRHPHQALPPGPLAVRWKWAKITTDHPMHVLRAYRVSLASLRPNQIVWEPYRDYLGSLPAYCTASQHIWRSIVQLIHFWVVEGHHPECVLRQFGMKQGVPNNVDTSIELHKITLQGKHEKNWVQEHATHIARWVAHATIAEAPPFHGNTTVGYCRYRQAIPVGKGGRLDIDSNYGIRKAFLSQRRSGNGCD